MANFYGGIKGKTGISVTRCGTKNSGMTAFVNGWNVGVFIQASHSNTDIINIFKTGGSNGYEKILIARITKDKLEVFGDRDICPTWGEK